ncbi:MAG: multiple resistance and pH regulation protein F [Geminicoccaceae bacterium]|nr:MAG: multiple resistance and pH regulation protein F [Geminicoccaceae bacterium]
MTAFLYVAGLVLLASLALGLVRLYQGPSAGDRMMVAQLFGTSGVALLVLLAAAMQEPAALDAALVLALLAAVTGLALVRSAIDLGDDH